MQELRGMMRMSLSHMPAPGDGVIGVLMCSQ